MISKLLLQICCIMERLKNLNFILFIFSITYSTIFCNFSFPAAAQSSKWVCMRERVTYHPYLLQFLHRAFRLVVYECHDLGCMFKSVLLYRHSCSLKLGTGKQGTLTV